MVLTAYFVLSPVSVFVLSPSSADFRFCQTRSGRRNLRQFNTSNGCQDHTALPYASKHLSSARPSSAHEVHLALRFPHVPDAAASTASRPASVTMANAPLWGGTASDIDLIWVGREREYFFKEDWTTQITLIPKENFLRARSANPQSIAASAFEFRSALRGACRSSTRAHLLMENLVLPKSLE